VVLTFAVVLTSYWKGLLGKNPAAPGGPMAGGGGMPPPPITGLASVTVSTLTGPAARTPEAGDGGLADGNARAARLDGPSALAMAASGALYVTDTRNHRLRAVAPDGSVTTLAGSGPIASAMGAFADGPAATARLWNPSGLAVRSDGAVCFTDTGNHRLRTLTAGRVRTLAGGNTRLDRLGLPDGAFANGPGKVARFRYPTGLAALPGGALLVVDTGNKLLRKVLPDGTTSTAANLASAGAQSPCGIAVLPDGRVLITDPAAEAVFQVAAGQVSVLPGINRDAPIWIQPTGIAADAAGNVYIADTGSHCIMQLTPGGEPTVLAGVVDVVRPAAGYTNGTGDAANFAAPCAIAVGPAGELYVADFGNNCVRKIVK